MKITVHGKPGAPREEIREVEIDGKKVYQVWVREQPVKGVANKAIALALAKHFGTTISRVRLITGGTSRIKIFSIE